MRKINGRSIVWIASGFCSGLFFVSLCFTYAPAAGFLTTAACALSCAFVSLFLKKKLAPIFFAAAMTAAFFLGYAQFFAFCDKVPDGVYTVDARIDGAVFYEDGARLTLSDAELVRSPYRTRLKISLFVENDGDFFAGDRIAFTARLTAEEISRNGALNGNAVAEKIGYYAYLGKTDTYYVAKGKPNLFERANRFLYDALRAGLGEDYPVAFALLTGETAYVETVTLDNFRSAGLAHIFAVSGLHIGFLAAALSFALKRLPLQRAVKNAVILAALFFYAGVCGFTPSALRAAVMCSVLLFAKGFGLKYDMLSSAAFAAIAVCALSPAQFFTAGFRLSFAAVFGIAAFSPHFARAFGALPKKLSSALGVTLSAQIGALPVSLFYFSYLPPLAVLLNLLAVPFVSVLFVLLLAGAAVSFFVPPAAALFFPKYFLRFLTVTAMLFDFGKVAVAGICVTAVLALFYYAAAFLAAGYVNMRRRALRLTCLTLSCVFVAGTAAVSVREFHAANVVVVAESNFFAVCVGAEGEELIVVCRAEGDFSASGARRFLQNRRSDGAILLFADQNTDVIAAYDLIEDRIPVKKVYYTAETDGNLMSKIFSEKDGFFERAETVAFAKGKVYANGEQTALLINGVSALFSCSEESVYAEDYALVVAPSFAADYQAPEGVETAVFSPRRGNLSYKICESKLKRL